MTKCKPACPYCGAEMIPQRESTGMMYGIDFAQCVECGARGPEIHTNDGDWGGKQKAALAAAGSGLVAKIKAQISDAYAQMDKIENPVYEIKPGHGRHKFIKTTSGELVFAWYASEAEGVPGEPWQNENPDDWAYVAGVKMTDPRTADVWAKTLADFAQWMREAIAKEEQNGTATT